MNQFPADEQWITDVERGRCCRVTVPAAVENRPVPGDVILFAHAYHRHPGEPEYVKGGDSVQVSLTEVVDLGTFDPLTSKPLFHISWSPLGQFQPPEPSRSRRGKSTSPR
ncbi:hypothetical protein OJF2_01220 [Aquisphaera giovannonii]|uniref:Uncharacterized protein n=1 Tax=Aquisphaera giovannonii TaxID=406548 RepID=A0A5B9VUV0_9BACT|nr:hypothetical protein [Aquisphaera giovannonii]QEH31657.1 hypothetical protein OJF2_01220 [Aquisphaera giovannonii]